MDSWVVHKRKASFNTPVYLKHYSIKSGTNRIRRNLPREHFSFSRNLADNDKDGRLTSDEFVVAMHCCDIVRTGQTLPTRLPDEWTKGTQTLRDRTGSLSRTNITPAFASLNQDLKDVLKSSNNTNENHSPETIENERKNNAISYEDRRKQNYEVCFN